MQEWPIDQWFDASWLAGAYPVLKVIFWGTAILWTLSVWHWMACGPSRKVIGYAYRVFFVLVLAGTVGILVYQATWQLTGFARPQFVEFTRVYNQRPDNPVRRMTRGRIVDAKGRILAVSSEDSTGRRLYPQGEIMVHVIGYEHRRFGLAGLEAADHARLSGIADASSQEWAQVSRTVLQRDNLRGQDLTLTLHLDLQQAAHEAMRGRRGAVVFLDPADGSLLVCYSSPGVDPNRIQSALFETQDPNAPLLNRALRGLYPPGSAFKLLVAAAALEQGLNPVFDTPPEGFQARGASQPIRDHEYYAAQRERRRWQGHGRLTLQEAFAKSSNIYFARLGVELGGRQLLLAAEQAGMNRAWVVHQGSSGTIGSAQGRFPTLTDAQQAAAAQVSIGQGELLVTPLHMAMLAAATANRGEVWQPRIATHMPPRRAESFFSARTAGQLVDMMRHAVTSGTGRAADLRGLQVAGKTGTAQNPHGADHGWFVGFAPADRPRVAFAVIVEQGGFGSQSALPVATAVLQRAHSAGLLVDSGGTRP